MPTYTYDDFEITFTPTPDGGYDMVADAPDGRQHRTRFRVPLSADRLEEAVLSIAAKRSRVARGGTVTREVAPAGEPVELDAEEVGAALAEALFADGVGAAYDAARETSSAAQHGLRLTLSLATAPALMSLPWEFLYRRPRFIASQRHLPLVRRLDTGSLTSPPGITDTVKILGVVSSPEDLSPLDVAAERSRVEQAVTKMVLAGRVELDWLEPATPGRLRKALRDSSYHILHYVGHSSFTAGNEGAIYLEDQVGRSVEVDSTVLANLLSDQNSLRLVVLNSCEGARTTLSDPYAGVATTLIELGVPAVVAMQFEISDQAAILFAEELYTNLIGRQDPIDAAVAEARKAIYIEIDRVEWATPVLFVRDPEVQLFDFKVPVAPLPPPPPPGLLNDTAERGGAGVRPLTDGVGDAPPVNPTGPGFAPVGPEPPVPVVRRRRRLRLPVVAAALAGVAALGVGAFVVLRDDAGEAAATTTVPTADTATGATTGATTDTGGTATPTTVARQGATPRPRTGFLAAQIREPSGDTHLYPVDLDSKQIGVITDKRGATDTQPDWDRATNRVAFTRSLPSAGEGTGIFYVVPGNFAGDSGKQVAPLIPWVPGVFNHVPAWTADGRLLYMVTDGCAPGPLCREQLRRAAFDAAPDAAGFLDMLTVSPGTDGPAVDEHFFDVTAIAAHPLDPSRAVVADASGLWLVELGQASQLFGADVRPLSVTYTDDGSHIVAVGDTAQGQLFAVWRADGVLVQAAPIVGASGGVRFVSISADPGQETLVGLAVSPLDETVSVLSRLRLTDDGLVGIDAVIDVTDLPDLGAAQAIAL